MVPEWVAGTWVRGRRETSGLRIEKDFVCLPHHDNPHPLSERPGAALQKRSGRFDSGMGVIPISILALV